LTAELDILIKSDGQCAEHEERQEIRVDWHLSAPLWKPDFEAVVRNYLGSGLMTVSEVLVIVFPEL
jgi:hypothetical protein